MEISAKFVVGLILLLAVQVLLGGTVVYFIRKRKRIEPAWSWPKTLGAYLLLGLLVTAVGLIPVVGRFVAVVVSLIGLKRISGLDVIPTFILSFCMGILIFAGAAVIGSQLQVDLIGLRD